MSVAGQIAELDDGLMDVCPFDIGSPGQPVALAQYSIVFKLEFAEKLVLAEKLAHQYFIHGQPAVRLFDRYELRRKLTQGV